MQNQDYKCIYCDSKHIKTKDAVFARLKLKNFLDEQNYYIQLFEIKDFLIFYYQNNLLKIL